jgi:hypothetical protein
MIRSTVLTLVKRRSTWAITSKTSPMTPNAPFWSTIVNPWSKPYLKPLNPFWPTSVSRNFCRVLQISPKHFKISQCKSCVFCRGTQLSCWVTFEIWSLNRWKTQVNAQGYNSQAPRKSKLCLQFVHNWLRKRPYALCEHCRGSRDLQLWYSSVCPLQFNFFGVSLSQTGLLEMFSTRLALSTQPRDAGAPHRAQPPWTRVVGPARTPRFHGSHAANAGGLGGAPPTCLPHSRCATRGSHAAPSATCDVAVLGRPRRPCRRPMPRPCCLGA